MLRKQAASKNSREPASFEGEISIADVATVQVTAEQADHPIDNAFDHNRGPGGSRWIADGPAEQTVVLLFDTPQTIRKIGVEEELAVSRTQELSVAVSSDGGRTYLLGGGRAGTGGSTAAAHGWRIPSRPDRQGWAGRGQRHG